MVERKRLQRLGAFGTSLLFAACAPAGANTPRPTGEVLGTTDQNIIEMGWPIDRTKPQRLTGAAHNYNKAPQTDMTAFPNLIRNELDLSNLNSVSCINNPNATMAFDTIASRSGTVISLGGELQMIKIKDDLGFFEQYTHLGDITVAKNQRVDQGDVIATSLECTPNNTGLHLDFAVSDATGAGVDMERVVFVDALGGKTKNTKAKTNYDGTMVMPDNSIVTADTRVCQKIESCNGIINIIPALGEVAEETPTAGIDAYFEQYLSPENTDTNQRFAAIGLKFWLERFLTKKDPVMVYPPMERDLLPDYKGASLQIDTNIEDWASEIPNILNNQFGEGWPNYTTPSEKVFSYHYKFSGEEKDEGEVEIKNLKMLAYGISDFSEQDIANGWERFESVAFVYLSRYRYLNPETNDWSEWSDWDDATEKEGRDYYSYRVKNGEVEMYCASCEEGLSSANARFFWPSNTYDDPRLEVPYFIDTREN